MSDKYINRIKKLKYNKEHKDEKKEKGFKIVQMDGRDIIKLLTKNKIKIK